MTDMSSLTEESRKSTGNVSPSRLVVKIVYPGVRVRTTFESVTGQQTRQPTRRNT